MLYSQTVNSGSKLITKRYNFPQGQLVTYPGTKRKCAYMFDWCSHMLTLVDRLDAAKALRKFKLEFTSNKRNKDND